MQSKIQTLEKQIVNNESSEVKDDLAEEQITVLQDMLKQKTLELDQAKETLLKLNEKVDDNDSESLKEDLESSNQKIADLKDSLERKVTDVNNLEQSLVEKSTELSLLQEKLQSSEKLGESNDNELKSLSNYLRIKEGQLIEAQSQIDELQNSIQLQTQTISSLTQDLEDKNSLVQLELIERLDSIGSEKQGKEGTAFSLEAVKAEHEKEIESYIEMCSGLNNQLSTLSEELSTQAQAKEDLEAEVKELKMSLEESQDLSKELSDLKDNLEHLQKEKARIVQESKALIDECEESKADLVEKNSLIDKLNAELANERKSLQDSKTQIEKALSKAKNLQASYDSLVSNQGDSKTLIQERDKAKTKCDMLTEKCKKLLVKCKQQEEIVKEQEKIKSSLKSTNEQLIAKEELISQLEQNLVEKNELVSEKEQEIMELEIASKTAGEMQTSELSDKIASLEILVEKKMTEISKLQNEATEAKVKLEEMETSEIDLKNELEDKDMEVSRLEKENCDIQEDIKNVENRLQDSKTTIQSLENDLSRVREEIKDVTINKNKLIEDAHKTLANLEIQLQEGQNEDKEESEALKVKIEELNSQIEKAREQKLNDDMNLAASNDTLKILKIQLAERDAEIAQVGSVMKQKDEDLSKARAGIQEIIGESVSCQAEKMQLRDQLDSLTIVAENLQSLQHQIHLKDDEIDHLKNELETAREELERIREDNQQNRPPPDITQYQAAQPDIASFQPQMQPDLMPGIGFQQQSPLDLVQDQSNQNVAADGWDDNGDWGANDGAGWFDNNAAEDSVQEAPGPQPEPQNEPEGNLQIVSIQQALDAKEAECFNLTAEVTALVNTRESLLEKIEELKVNNENMQEKMAELEQAFQHQSPSNTTNQNIQCQPDTKSQSVECQPEMKNSETLTSSPSPALNVDIPQVSAQDAFEQSSESLQSPPPNVFAWDNVMGSNTGGQDFFSQATGQDFFDIGPQKTDSSSVSSVPVQEIPVEAKKEQDDSKKEEYESHIFELQKQLKESSEALEAMKNAKNDLTQEMSKLEGHVKDLEEQSNGSGEKINALVYEKTMLEEQISQLPSMDAFKSLQRVNEELSDESGKLKKKFDDLCSYEEYDAMKKSNEELKLKLASIAESQNEQYEVKVKELSSQIDSLRLELERITVEYERATSELQDVKKQQEQPVVAFESPQEQTSGYFTFQQSAADFFDQPIATPKEDQSNEELEQIKKSYEEVQKANEILSEESLSLKLRVESSVSKEDYETVVRTNEELAAKLSEVAQQEQQALEQRTQDLQRQVDNLELQLQEAQSRNNIVSTEDYQIILKSNEELRAKVSEISAANQEFGQERVQSLTQQVEELNCQIAKMKTNYDAVFQEFELLQQKKAATPSVIVQEEQPVTETIPVASFFDQPQETGKTELKVQGQTVEQGLSASSYFDQFGASPTSVNETVGDTSVFESIGKEEESQKVEECQEASVEQTSESSETINWYKNQLEQYQQAINDWQAWSQTQFQEVTTLKESLAYYTNLDQNAAKDKEENSELNSLRASVKAKEIEVEDLIETVDRLKAEKSDLEQEVTELTMQNQDLKQQHDEISPPVSDGVDIALYEETKQSLDENTEKLMRITEELSLKNNKLEEALKLKDDSDNQLAKLQKDLSSMKEELENVKETKSSLEKSMHEADTLKSTIEQSNQDLLESVEKLNYELESMKAQVNDSKPSEIPVSSEEIDQLRAEVEQQKGVLNDWNLWGKQKTEEYDTLLEAYNQYVASHTQLSEDITKLNQENETLKAQVTSQVSEEKPPEVDISQSFDNESKGWGGLEEDVLQGESADNSNNNALLELEGEISELKQKIRTEQDEKSKLNEELNAAKVKHGKLTLKVKQLTKELQNRKSASPASTATGDDSLDKAIQEELNQRAAQAEKSLKDTKQQLNEVNQEKSRLLERIDTLEAGNERFMELKEAQDREVQHLKNLEQTLQSKLGGFEWQLSEKDEQIINLEDQLKIVNEQLNSNPDEQVTDQLKLKSEVVTLRRSLAEMESNCILLKSQVEELEEKLQVSISEKGDMTSQLIDAQDKLDSLNEEMELLRNVQSQYESLKLSQDQELSEKSSMDDYQNFQMLNQNMQQEILQLRAYIQQQQELIQSSNMPDQAGAVGQDQQILASLVYERNRVSQLEKDLQNKDENLKTLQGELDQMQRTSRATSQERRESLSSEVGRLLATNPDNDLVLQNERLKYDLVKSVGERRVLSQQMENWKKQLTVEASGESEMTDPSEHGAESEDFMRLKQEQAYRSVGALQLRVEELTLEVTKVIITFLFLIMDILYKSGAIVSGNAVKCQTHGISNGHV